MKPVREMPFAAENSIECSANLRMTNVTRIGRCSQEISWASRRKVQSPNLAGIVNLLVPLPSENSLETWLPDPSFMSIKYI
jgi:hypothetical protein